MATPLDGWGIAVPQSTWASVFDYLRWQKYDQDGTDLGLAEATGPDESLMVTGKEHLYYYIRFEFSNQLATLNLGWLNHDYYSEFVGHTFTPAGQGWGPYVTPSGTTTYITKSPFAMTYELVHDGFQYVDAPPPQGTLFTFWYPGVEGIEGFVDQTV